MKRRGILVSLATVLPLANVGCLLPFGPNDIRTEVCRTTGAQLKPDLTVTTDGLTLTVLSGLLPMRVPVWHIAWLSVGVYEMTAPAKERPAFGRLELRGWERISRVREDGSETLIFVQAGDRPLRAMAVLVKEDDQLLIVKMIGRLDRLIAHLVGPYGWGPLPSPAFATGPKTKAASGNDL